MESMEIRYEALTTCTICTAGRLLCTLAACYQDMLDTDSNYSIESCVLGPRLRSHFYSGNMHFENPMNAIMYTSR